MKRNFYKCNRCKEGLNINGIVPEGVLHSKKCKGELILIRAPKTSEESKGIKVKLDIDTSEFTNKANELLDVLESMKECEHDYRIGVNNLELVVYRADEEIKYTPFDGSALFYCTKCLHIETKVYK